VWIGSIVERATGRVVLYQIMDRSQDSLIPPIQRKIPHGSFIYSDEWASYKSLSNYEYTHFTVNHSAQEYARQQQFDGEILNVHINTAEGINREIRRRFSNKSSRNTERIDLVLSEIMYRRCGRSLFYPFKI